MGGWRALWLCLMLVVLWSGVVLADQEDELEAIRHLVDTGQHEQALQRLEAFIGRQPGAAPARFLQGLILARQHRMRQALDVFEALTRDYPTLPEPYNNLAVLHASQGRYEKARDALLTAIKTHPSYARAHENLGNVYARMASMAYNQALELHQENKSAQLKLDLIGRLFMVQNNGVVKVEEAGSNQANHTPILGRSESSTPEVVASPQPAVETQRIIETVQAWARAWADRDVEAYLAFYAPDFKPPEGLTPRAWRELRRQRLRTPRFIKLAIGDPDVALLTNSVARARFRQTYASNTYRGTADKLLLLTRDASQWRIQEEWVMR